MPGEPFAFLKIRVVSEDEITNWDFEKLRYAINYIYARNGYPLNGVKEQDLRREFEKFDWYKPAENVSMEIADQKMSSIESENIKLLAAERGAKAHR